MKFLQFNVLSSQYFGWAVPFLGLAVRIIKSLTLFLNYKRIFEQWKIKISLCFWAFSIAKRILLLYQDNKKKFLILISFKFQFNDKNYFKRDFCFDVNFSEEFFPSHDISLVLRKFPFRKHKQSWATRISTASSSGNLLFFPLLLVITDCHRTTAINQFQVQQLVDEEERCSFCPPNDILMRSPQSRWEWADKSIKK